MKYQNNFTIIYLLVLTNCTSIDNKNDQVDNIKA
jgi:hypothetical protein